MAVASKPICATVIVKCILPHIKRNGTKVHSEGSTLLGVIDAKEMVPAAFYPEYVAIGVAGEGKSMTKCHPYTDFLGGKYQDMLPDFTKVVCSICAKPADSISFSSTVATPERLLGPKLLIFNFYSAALCPGNKTCREKARTILMDSIAAYRASFEHPVVSFETEHGMCYSCFKNADLKQCQACRAVT